MPVQREAPDFDLILRGLGSTLGERIKKRQVFQLIYAKVVERIPAFIQAIKRGEAPILACADALNGLTKKLASNDLSLFLDHAITTILTRLGYVRAFSSSRALEPRWLYLRVTNFFRPSEELLFERLNDSDQVLLFTTQEEQRFVTALINERARLPFDGRVLVWTLASGFLEPVSSTSTALFPTVDPRRSSSTLQVVIRRLSELTDGDPRKAAVEAFLHRQKEDQPKEEQRTNGTKAPTVLELYDEDQHCVTAVADDRSEELDSSTLTALSEVIRGRALKAFAKEMREKIKEELRIAPQARFAAAIRKVLDPEWPDGIYIFLDVHRELEAGGPSSNLAENVRIVRDAYRQLQSSSAKRKLVLFAHDFTIPEDLLQEVTSMELPLPGRAELAAALRSLLSSYPSAHMPSDNVDAEKFDLLRRAVDAVTGLTLQQSLSAVRMLAERHGRVPTNLPDLLQEFKCQQLNSDGVLSLVRDLPNYGAGGLDRLSTWLDGRRRVFEKPDEAERYGIDRRPKGVLMLGISGSGKSLAAKLVARDWGLPLLRLDVGAIYDKWVGSSEARLRRALRVAETIAPCVLWIDELEKGFGKNQDSSGVSQRVLGDFLVWMQETSAPVFTVATANDVTRLPPELTRAGRFDNRFFLGCPGQVARRAILTIHLTKRGHDPERLVDEALIQRTHGLTGAELEQVVLDSLYTAYAAKRALTPRDLLATAEQIKPLITVLGSAMEHVWDMVDNGRAELASSDTLSRRDVAQLIDPHRFTPMYCRLKSIRGYEAHAERGERIVASQPTFGSAACVLSVDDPHWVYVQCNFTYARGDEFAFKFLDRIATIETNDVFFMLCRDHGLDAIVFETEGLRDRFVKSPYLSELGHLFSVYGTEAPMPELSVNDN